MKHDADNSARLEAESYLNYSIPEEALKRLPGLPSIRTNESIDKMPT